MIHRVTKDFGRTYTAGFESEGGIVVRAAPILHRFLGEHAESVRSYCEANFLELLTKDSAGVWHQVFPVHKVSKHEYNVARAKAGRKRSK